MNKVIKDKGGGKGPGIVRLGFWAVSLMTAAAVVSLRGLPMMAKEGLAMWFYIGFATLFFVIVLAVCLLATFITLAGERSYSGWTQSPVYCRPDSLWRCALRHSGIQEVELDSTWKNQITGWENGEHDLITNLLPASCTG